MRGQRVYLDLGADAVRDVVDLIDARHGGPCDTDDGDPYFQAALPCLMSLGRDPVAWAERWTPVLFAERGAAWFGDRADEFAVRPYGSALPPAVSSYASPTPNAAP